MAKETLRFKIEGMTCASCAYHAHKALERLTGVTEVVIDSWHQGNARLLIDADSVTEGEIAKALDEIGYSIAKADENADTADGRSKSPSPARRRMTPLLLIFMLAGIILVTVVFVNNRQSLPINTGRIDVDAAVFASGSILPVISTDNAPNDLSFLNIGETPVVNAAGEVRIPDPDRSVTVFLAGIPGCSTCGIEAQYLSNILEDLGTDNLRIVFVDVYNMAGSDNLAWFANVLEATNLTWAIDTTGTFRQQYAVDIDSTVIMNRSGKILYRDDFVT
ncbi:MAG: cation transporter, partial [Chloroflexi bacterium]|nr:cation transporter [Chloroflexota bacterium]